MTKRQRTTISILITIVFLTSGCKKNIEDIKVDNNLIAEKITTTPSANAPSNQISYSFNSREEFFSFLAIGASINDDNYNVEFELDSQKIIPDLNGVTLISPPTLPYGKSTLTTKVNYYFGDNLEWDSEVLVEEIDQKIDPDKQFDPKGNSYEAYECAKREISKSLWNPKTSEFPENHKEYVKPLGNYKYDINSYVDAQNAIGAEIRNSFSCTVVYDPENIACGSRCFSTSGF